MKKIVSSCYRTVACAELVFPPLAVHDPNTSAASISVASDPTAAEPPRPEGGGAGLWALFLGLGLMMVGNGLNGALIGVRSTNEGFSVTVTGMIMAGYFAGFLIAPSVVVRKIPSVGHIRVFAGLASTASSAVLIHSVWVEPISWMAMRFIFGFCMAGLYIVIESWLGDMTDSSNRGQTMAIYMIVSMGGLGLGQYLIALADPNSFRLFVVSSVLVSMALVPVTLAATTKAPVMTVPEPVTIRKLLTIVPTGVIGSFMSGAATGVLFGLSAVYATSIGLSLERTAFFLVAPTIGAILMQWPIGRLSDQIGRRKVIFGVAIGAACSTLTLMFLPEQSLAVPLMMIALGGMMFPLYSLVVSYTLDWTDDSKVVGTSGTLVRINGSGALIGPLVAAPLMSQFGSRWFFWAMATCFSVIVVYVAWRMLVREALPMERQKKFVPFPARAGALAIGIVAKPVRKATKLASGKHVTSRRHTHPADAQPSSLDPADREVRASELDDGSPMPGGHLEGP